MASKLKSKIKETAIKKMEDHDIWNYVESGEDIDLKKAYERLVNSGFPMDYKTFRIFAHGYMGGRKSRFITHKTGVPIEDQKMARALDALHSHGFDESMPGDYNPARADAYANKKYLYRDGTNTSPREDFGEILHDVSTKDYIVYRGGEGTLSPDGAVAMFRGSRLGYERNTLKDWLMNFGGYLNKELTKKLQKSIFDDFDRSMATLEERGIRLAKTAGYSRGGPLAYQVAQKYEVPSVSFNGDMGNNMINISKTKANAPHRSLRTQEDPVSMFHFRRPKATLGLVKGYKIETVPNLKAYEGDHIFNSHDFKHFTEDGNRAVLPKSTAKMLGIHYKKMMLNELNLLDLAHEMRGKSFAEFHEEAMKRGYTIHRTNPEYDTGVPPQEGIELQEPEIPPRPQQSRLPTPEELRRTTLPRRSEPAGYREEFDDGAGLFPNQNLRPGQAQPAPTPTTAFGAEEGLAYGLDVPLNQIPRALQPAYERIREVGLQQYQREQARVPAPSTPFGAEKGLAYGLDVPLNEIPRALRPQYKRIREVGLQQYQQEQALQGREKLSQVGLDLAYDRQAPIEQFPEHLRPYARGGLRRLREERLRNYPREQKFAEMFPGFEEATRLPARTAKLGARAMRAVGSTLLSVTEDDEDLLDTQPQQASEEFRSRVNSTTSNIEVPEDLNRIPPENNSIFSAYQSANDGDIESLGDLEFNHPDLNSVMDLKRMLSPQQYEAYLKASPEERLAIKKYLMEKIQDDMRAYHANYHSPMARLGTMMREATPRAGGMAGGMFAGVAVDYVEDKLGVDPNTWQGQFLEGSTGQMAGELIGRGLTGELRAGTALANVGRVVEGGLSGGLQAVLTDPMDKLNKMWFDVAFPKANAYVRDITSDTLGAGLAFATATGITMGGTYLAGLAGLVALNAWNPGGWALAIGGGLALLGGALFGWFEGKSDAEKEQQEKETKYALQAQTLKAQYGNVRELLTELGDNPAKLLELDQELAGKLGDKDVKAFGQDKDGNMPGMTDLMNRYLSSFNLKNVNYLSNTNALQLALQNQQNREMNITNGLIQNLKSHGVDLTKPLPAGASQAMQNLSKLPFFANAQNLSEQGFSNFTEYYKQYNEVIDYMKEKPALKGILDQMGLQNVPVPSEPGSLLDNVIPSGFSKHDTKNYEQQISSGAGELQALHDQANLEYLSEYGKLPTQADLQQFMQDNLNTYGQGAVKDKLTTVRGLQQLNNGINPITGKSLTVSPIPQTLLEYAGIKSTTTTTTNPTTGQTTPKITYALKPGVSGQSQVGADVDALRNSDSLPDTFTNLATLGSDGKRRSNYVVPTGASPLGNMSAPLAHTQEPSEPDPPVQTNAGQVNQLRVRNPKN